MAIKTFRVPATSVTTSWSDAGAILTESDVTAANRTDHWIVAKVAAGNSASFTDQQGVASTNFTSESTNPKPASTDIHGGNPATGFVTPAALTGIFAATAWTFTFAVRAGTASSQAGRIRMRVFKSTSAVDGGVSGFTELTGAVQVGTTSSALSTTADVTSVVTWSPGSLTLSSEYLFFIIAWEITTASGSNSGDVQIRTGQAAGGSRFVTPDFAPGVAGAVKHQQQMRSEVAVMRGALR
jgi:hypothetical protein